jgi:hypothetical protein
MLLLSGGTSDKLQIVTAATGDIEVDCSYVDLNASFAVSGAAGARKASIATATTTDILAGAASTYRNLKHLNVRNNHASVAQDVKVQTTDGTNTVVLMKATLLVGESIVFNQNGLWVHFDSNGIPRAAGPIVTYSASSAAQASTFASDTYVTGSFIVLPAAPAVGGRYTCTFDITKTAAGTATPILQVRTGTAGTTSDTSRTSHTFAAGTAAASTARVSVESVFRAVGSGTSAVLVTNATIENTGTTGVIGAACGVVNTVSSGFDSTTAGLGIGVSFNGGASFSGTVQQVQARWEPGS